MPKALSNDLRKRIVDAYKAGEGSYNDLAARFHVGYATVNRILARHRKTWLIPALRSQIQSSPALLAICGNDSWNAVMALIAILHFLAALCWLLLPLRGNVFDYSLVPPK